MKKFFYLLLFISQLVMAQNSTVIGDTIYQNQAFSTKDKEIFDSDKEGSRVWNWSQAQRYCKRLKLDGHSGWRVASQKELQLLMSKTPKSNGLYIHPRFAHNMPKIGGRYDDIWMWTRDKKSTKIGAFVNFKKAKQGWAEKRYKGYVLCTRKVSTSRKKNRLKKVMLFESNAQVWRSDMSPKGTYALGAYQLSDFQVCGIIPLGYSREHACSDESSGFVRFGKYKYFFAHKGSSKILNIYRTDGTKKGTKKIASLGKKVAYMPMVIAHNLYFMRSSYVPFQTEPPDRELWVVDMKRAKAKKIIQLNFDTSINGSNYFSMYASSKSHLFLQAHHYDEKSKITNKELWLVEKNNKNIRKLKEFKDEIPENLKSIKVSGVINKLTKVPNNSSFGWERFIPKGEFSIKEGFLLHKGAKIANLSKIKGLISHKANIVYNSKEDTIIESSGKLWGVDDTAKVLRLQ